MKKNFKTIAIKFLSCILLVGAFAQTVFADDSDLNPEQARLRLMWMNHLDLLPGDASVTTTFNAIQSGGLVVHSSSLGDTSPSGGNKTVEMTLQVPPRYNVRGVRVCYQNSSAATFITQIRLAQLQNPPTSWLVRLDDATDRTGTTPVCVNSAATNVDPETGSVRFSLRLNFGSLNDSINILATGLWLQPR